jgi:hypothetical protein
LTEDESWRNELTKAGTPRKRAPRKPGPKWEPKSVEIVHEVVFREEYEQILNEFAEVVYRHLTGISEGAATKSVSDE